METITNFLSLLINITLLVMLIVALRTLWSIRTSAVIKALRKISEEETPARPAQENIPGSNKAIGVLSWIIAIIP